MKEFLNKIGLFRLHELRAMKDKILDNQKLKNLSLKLYAFGLRANYITLFNAVIGFVAIYFLFENTLVFALLLILNSILDAVDGLFARYTNSSSKLGDKLDHFFDIVFPFLALVKSYFYYTNGWVLALIIFFVFEAVYLWSQKQIERWIPTKTAMIFFAFGLNELGLLIQGIYEPVTFILFLVNYWNAPVIDPPGTKVEQNIQK